MTAVLRKPRRVVSERSRSVTAKRRKAKPVFSIAEASEMAFRILTEKPFGHTARVEPVGELIERFVLPLSLVQPQNRTHGKTWLLGQLKSQCLAFMQSQLVTRRTSPLSGRPQVLCIRFSTTEPDKYSNGFKVAVDRLKDLRLIVDDAPKFIDVNEWWEKAPRGKGCGVIEVWSGQQ